MAIKLIRHAGTITVSTMGDDAAHSVDCGLLGKGQVIRVSEFGGQDVFVKVTDSDTATAATSSNGIYLKGSSSILIAPEGTRKRVEKWKTGFYYIALKANLPILMVSFDYIRKEVKINNKFYPSGDIDKDFIELKKKVNDVVIRNTI